MNKKIISKTPFGPVAMIWTEENDRPKIVRVVISKPGRGAEEAASRSYPGAHAASCGAIDAVAEAIKANLEGDDREISLDVADLGVCSRFQESVLRAEHGIPRGRVSTYRLIAVHLGRTRAARAIGNALANNPFPIIVPCHRAVRSDRRLGGYQGGLKMKRALLENEGITVDPAGRVVCDRFYYE